MTRLLLPSAALVLALGLPALGCGDGRTGAPAAGEGAAEAPSSSAMLEAGRRPTRDVPAVESPWRGEGRTIEVSVWEMHCAGCELEIENLLKEIEGIVAARANFETSVVEIEITDATLRQALIAKVREAMHGNERFILGEDEVPSRK